MNTLVDPFFSIVIPVYNKGPYIRRAVYSALGQCFQCFEIILVCEPSFDNSYDEACSFNDPRIRVFSRDEVGPGGYAARNLGILKAKANWVAFLDADDEWYPNHLSFIFDLIKKESSQYFFAAGFDEISNKAIIRNGLVCDSPYKVVTFEEYLNFSPFYTSSTVVNRRLILDVGGFPEGLMKRGGDVDTWLRAIERSGGYIMSGHVGAKYFKNSSNMVTRNNAYSENEIKNHAIKKMIDKYRGTPLEKKLKKKFNNQVIYAWNQNMHLEVKSNFSLSGRLYIKEQFLKASLYLAFSKIPGFLSIHLHRLLYFFVCRFRKL